MPDRKKNTPEPQEQTVPQTSFTPVDGEIVHLEETDAWTLQLVLSADEMQCLASVAPKNAGEGLIEPDQIITRMKDARITEGIDMAQIKRLCVLACEGKMVEHVAVAHTEPATPGADGWLELKVRLGAGLDGMQEFVEDEHGRIDLYTLDLFTCIQPLQKVAMLHPPQPGNDSVTVTGRTLKGEPGTPANVRMGAGVHLNDANEVVSDISGRAEFSDGTISVSEDYNIHGDVDLHVGNISFPGNVNISGDVLDDFDISSDKDITVKGTVGSCYLKSGGDISVGGISGQYDTYVKCAGNLEARYINGAHIECMGDVIVANEIRNSTVKSAGMIMVKNGQISSGEYIALKGIEAKIIGAAAGAPTLLTSGVYFPEGDRLAFLKAQKRSIKKQNEFIRRCVGPLEQKAAASENSAHSKRLEILLERLEILEQMDKNVRAELSSFVMTEHESNPKINVHRLIKEKVEIHLENAHEQIRLDQYGPLSIIPDVLNGILSFNEFSPLEVNAAEMQPVGQEESEES
ncbi:MAG: FapA family protein [Desulfuromonadaceae bacterium]|nr:FapA family protein [Desulfuromonas sp.]MDY0185082.1 FapA family protein [Desulfuromonadaceae bacterium]